MSYKSFIFIPVFFLVSACGGKASNIATSSIPKSHINKSVVVENANHLSSLNSKPVPVLETEPVVQVETSKQLTLAPTKMRRVYDPGKQKKVYKAKPTRNVHLQKTRKRLQRQYQPHVKKVAYKPRRHVSRPINPRKQVIPRFAKSVSNAALNRLRSKVRYDGKYVPIAYPWGDVPSNTGVCTDVVVRTYRQLGIDLQQLVHNDMKNAFGDYPNVKKWNLHKPDPNIDHRRVYNLQAYFARKGAELPITRNPRDYKPGDLVTWMVGPNFPHIGVVVNRPSKADPNRMMIVHNIAHGPQLEDILFKFPMTGHYRFTPQHIHRSPQRLFPHNTRTARSNVSDSQLIADAARRLSVTRSVPNKTQDQNSVKLAQKYHMDLDRIAKDLNLLR